MATPLQLLDYYGLGYAERGRLLSEEIARCHAYHFSRNTAYRRTVSARGVGEEVRTEDLARLLRPAALTFKGYVEWIGPFPQDDPAGFVSWLGRQLSVPLPIDLAVRLRRRYRSLEALLVDVERCCAGLGLEIVTSSGTSGQASIVARGAGTVALAVQSFFTGIQRGWGIARGTALIFVMPEQTRVAMARSARFGTRELDWVADSPVHYTMPFSATPDRIRIRAGRTYRPGWEGVLERKALHPLMTWANESTVTPRFVSLTLERLREAAVEARPVLLLGGPAQLHAIALQDTVTLPSGSRVATGGGMKEQYPFSLEHVRADLRRAFGAPVSDVYGMAEANWAAFECPVGNYHLPPWVHVVVTDDDDRIIDEPEAAGLLAFFDPVGGGDLIPPFFQTADSVRLVKGGGYDPVLACPCGSDSAYISGRILRVDLTEEAGCAAQI